MASKAKKVSSGGENFRRFITTRNGKKLDAHNYGLKAFPIGRSKKRKPR